MRIKACVLAIAVLLVSCSPRISEGHIYYRHKSTHCTMTVKIGDIDVCVSHKTNYYVDFQIKDGDMILRGSCKVDKAIYDSVQLDQWFDCDGKD